MFASVRCIFLHSPKASPGFFMQSIPDQLASLRLMHMHFSGSSLSDLRAGVVVMELTGFFGGGFCPNLRLGLGGLLTYFPGLLLISWMVDCISFSISTGSSKPSWMTLDIPQDQVQIAPSSQPTGHLLQQE